MKRKAKARRRLAAEPAPLTSKVGGAGSPAAKRTPKKNPVPKNTDDE